MRKINTLAELKAEQKALRFHKTFLEGEIRREFAELKEDLALLKIVTKSASNMFSSKDNGLLSNLFGSVAEFLTKNLLFRNSGFFTRMVIPFLAKNTSSNIVENHKHEIINWIGNLITGFLTKKTVEE